MQAYKDKGAEEAIKAWLDQSPLEGSKDAIAQSNNLRMIESYYGAYRGYDLVTTRNVTPTTHVFYLVLNYEKGPLFGRFIVYKSKQAWIVTSFDFNTKLDAIIPFVLLQQ